MQAPSRSFPRSGKIGAAIMLLGLFADLIEHTLISHAHDLVVAGFPVGEHAAHFVVLIGMVILLAAVVIDGTARSHGRPARPERGRSDALR